MRNLPVLLLFFFFSISYGQTRKVRCDYTNGRIESKGKIYFCPYCNKDFPCNDRDNKCIKKGKWIYYGQDGKIVRIENYKKNKNCLKGSIPNGKWQYFNELGNLIKVDEYNNGLLWNADIVNFYSDTTLVGKIQVRNGVKDTVLNEKFKPDSFNLIKNGSFNLYLGEPVFQLKNGQNRIEKQIPYWVTPNNNTPDYYNQFRRLVKVPDNFDHAINEKYDYVGIILYHHPTRYYSEYITGEFYKHLIPEKRYCFKISIRLSQNSGYCIDRLGIYFSDSVPALPDTKDIQGYKPQIMFGSKLENKDAWTTLCADFVAKGNERFVTVGRFSGISEISIQEIKPMNFSEGELNQSAYYLIDKIEILESVENCKCSIDKKSKDLEDRIEFDLINPNDSVELTIGKTFILRNIFFDFDQSVLLPASFSELEKLLVFLKNSNKSITIFGHTDSIGTDKYNLDLSVSRARAVVDWLIAKGIDPKRLSYEGFGSTQPLVENSSPENRALNRRVEFRITLFGTSH